jgi:signal transduction histidine kinase
MSQSTQEAVSSSEPDARELKQLLTLGRLVSSVGHELQQPLAVIRNAVYFLNQHLGENLDEKVRKHMSLIWHATGTASNSISDLLAFTEAQTPERSDTSVNVLMVDALSRVKVPPEIRVTTLLHDSLPDVRVDPVQMVRVLVNLLNNAIEAMPGKGILTITGAALGNEVTLEIADNGPGIPAEDLPLVTEPLFTTKTGHKGLGLAIARSLTERNGGTLVLKSVPGMGTTSILTFPGHASRMGAGVDHGE